RRGSIPSLARKLTEQRALNLQRHRRNGGTAADDCGQSRLRGVIANQAAGGDRYRRRGRYRRCESRQDSGGRRTFQNSHGPGGWRRRQNIMPTVDQVREALKEVKDPEINLPVLDLGLIYDVSVEGENGEH